MPLPDVRKLSEQASHAAVVVNEDLGHHHNHHIGARAIPFGAEAPIQMQGAALGRPPRVQIPGQAQQTPAQTSSCTSTTHSSATATTSSTCLTSSTTRDTCTTSSSKTGTCTTSSVKTSTCTTSSIKTTTCTSTIPHSSTSSQCQSTATAWPMKRPPRIQSPAQWGGRAVANNGANLTLTATDCPSANNTMVIVADVSYRIHCNADNEEPSASTSQITSGGYAGCFAECSNSTSCAGFTFVGLDGGNCYFKSDMPEALYVAKTGNNYISCSKVTVDTSSTTTTPTSSQPTHAGVSNGVIAGVTIGAMVFLAVLVLLGWSLQRRYRHHKELADARPRTTLGGFVLPESDAEKPPLPMHIDTRSTGHDIFSPYTVGHPTETDSYQSPALSPHIQPASHHARQRSAYSIQELDASSIRKK